VPLDIALFRKKKFVSRARNEGKLSIIETAKFRFMCVAFLYVSMCFIKEHFMKADYEALNLQGSDCHNYITVI